MKVNLNSKEKFILKKISDHGESEVEIAAKRDAAIRRALNTPPTALKKYVGKSSKSSKSIDSEAGLKTPSRSKPKSSEP